PAKLRLSADYASRASLLTDLGLILATLRRVLRG
ncbi:MAG: sugar transferase, partial [Proteobacteria bacterium]|nr:sugar transferase [Pseudomonadota bacterium]